MAADRIAEPGHGQGGDRKDEPVKQDLRKYAAR